MFKGLEGYGEGYDSLALVSMAVLRELQVCASVLQSLSSMLRGYTARHILRHLLTWHGTTQSLPCTCCNPRLSNLCAALDHLKSINVKDAAVSHAAEKP